MSTTPPRVTLVAEIGCNHMGQFAIASSLVEAASLSGADIVKFQKRNPKECLSEEQYKEPYTTPNSFGQTYGAHREHLELTIEEHAELRKRAKTNGVQYAASVWDITSLHQIAALDPAWIKVPSAHNEDGPLLRAIRDDWKGEVHASNGMATREAEEKLVDLFGSRLVLYACTSTYPTEFRDVNLLDMERLRQTYGDAIKGIGWSGHHRGISIDIAAIALGARYVERHFTLDRTWKGTDQAASLEPQGFATLSRDIKALESAWNVRNGILPCEEAMAEKLKRIRE